MKRYVLTIRRGGVAAFVALVVNAGLLVALAALNNQASTSSDEEVTSVTFTDLAPPRPEPPREQPEPAPERDTTDRMEARIEAPSPESPRPTPVSLDVSISAPSPSPVQVAVTPTATPMTDRDNTGEGEGDGDASQDERGSRTTRLRELPGNPEPTYPRHLRRRRVTGTVRVRLTVNAEGRVQNVEYLSGKPAFRARVEQVIHEWRFVPAGEDDPRLRVGTTRINFRMED